MFNRRIGELVRKARHDAQLTQVELAKILDVNQSTLSDIENGHNNITAWMLRRITLHLGCKLRITLVKDDYETT